MGKTIDGERLDHVIRASLPWRFSALTECGLPIASHPALSREAFFEKLKQQGQQRTAMTTCMTCWQTLSQYTRAWRQSTEILTTLSREIAWAMHRDPVTLPNDLQAIAMLIERHRAEFDELVEDIKVTVPLASVRGKRRV